MCRTFRVEFFDGRIDGNELRWLRDEIRVAIGIIGIRHIVRFGRDWIRLGGFALTLKELTPRNDPLTCSCVHENIDHS